MDPAEIKAEVGDRLSFLGGVDSQHNMRVGTPEEVRAEVKQRIEQMGPGGGYILAPSHNIGDDVPLDNILTFFDAAKEYGKYPLGL
jgi:uroporphyrinogen decarboxylase